MIKAPQREKTPIPREAPLLSIRKGNDIRPIPPILSKILAKIIEPATGASTWALGSHMWVINMGNFTKKGRDAMRPKVWRWGVGGEK